MKLGLYRYYFAGKKPGGRGGGPALKPGGIGGGPAFMGILNWVSAPSIVCSGGGLNG